MFLLFGHLWGDTPASFATAAKLFKPVWLVVSVANLWIGVSKAGYTVAEELPILLIVFAVPAALAGAAAGPSRGPEPFTQYASVRAGLLNDWKWDGLRASPASKPNGCDTGEGAAPYLGSPETRWSAIGWPF